MSQNVHPANSYGFLKAELAEIEERAELVRAQIIALGLGAHEGESFRATVSAPEVERIDWKGIAESLKPSLRLPRDKWSEQITELVDSLTTKKSHMMVRVVARIGKKAAA